MFPQSASRVLQIQRSAPRLWGIAPRRGSQFVSEDRLKWLVKATMLQSTAKIFLVRLNVEESCAGCHRQKQSLSRSLLVCVIQAVLSDVSIRSQVQVHPYSVADSNLWRPTEMIGT